MKKIITYIGLLGLGAFVGWYGHTLTAFFSVKPAVVSEAHHQESLLPAFAVQNTQTISVPDFFSNANLLNSIQLGMVIELIKQDLDVAEKQKLNEEVVMYAKALLANSAADANTEQRLLALLGNFDTKEFVLDILAQFYVQKKQYEQAISSLFTLRSMMQFDEDYKKVSKRIDVLSKKNLKRLKAYNYKAEMERFYEFLLEKEPDNFLLQMQYAKFEYDNRKYAHVEQLLATLLYHPDYASKAEVLLQKARHQIDMIENGVVPVPVKKSGDHYVVSALVNNQEQVELIIDTGATLTILSPKVIQNLGLRLDDVEQYREFSTANGVVTAPIIVLDTFRVQNYLVHDLKVGVLSAFSGSGPSGLLGMNFLNQFAFFIDQKNSTLELVEVE